MSTLSPDSFYLGLSLFTLVEEAENEAKAIWIFSEKYWRIGSLKPS